jgi:hypothetical protein
MNKMAFLITIIIIIIKKKDKICCTVFVESNRTRTILERHLRANTQTSVPIHPL